MIIDYPDLPLIRKKHKEQSLVFCSGSFDLFHAGHVLFLEDCKKHGDILIVGVGSDAVLRRLKGGGRPILDEQARLKVLDSVAIVDYCILDSTSHEDRPLSFVEKVLKDLRPDVYVINEDAFDVPSRKELVEEYGVELKIMKRTYPPALEGVSTTKIIEKIRKIFGEK